MSEMKELGLGGLIFLKNMIEMVACGVLMG